MEKEASRKWRALHITGRYMLRSLRSLRGYGWLGHSALLHSHASLHPHFCGCWNAPRSLIATAKTSYTAGTLCDIPPKLGWEIV
jgi:hypothetical protein